MIKELKIPFNKPYLHGRELVYIAEAVASGKICGDGMFTDKCHQFFEETYSFSKALLTTSCTDALEMCAILLDIKSGDEIIAPSYTFVSTVNAFVLRGAKIVFADSQKSNPNIDHAKLEELITERTKAIVVVHYAGIACDMDPIIELSKKYGITVIEDAAQAIDSYYKGRALGSIGDMSTFSFHETKNIICGEGGLWVGNNKNYHERAEIIREKGTNRSSFYRGEVNKYGWIDIGSSFLPTDIVAAYLYAQLENIKNIQDKRKSIWNRYADNLKNEVENYGLSVPSIPKWATNNAHMYYLVCDSYEQRVKILSCLKEHNILGTFHYQCLHKSPFYKDKYKGPELENSNRYSDQLMRLPLFYELNVNQIDIISEIVLSSIKN
jgi:dTDP-4-amino-4,6-dideoxygalactose transaminase